MHADPNPDFSVQNAGTIFLFVCNNEAARRHLEENTDGMWMGDALVVEHRYAMDLALGLQDDGWKVGN